MKSIILLLFIFLITDADPLFSQGNSTFINKADSNTVIRFGDQSKYIELTITPSIDSLKSIIKNEYNFVSCLIVVTLDIDIKLNANFKKIASGCTEDENQKNKISMFLKDKVRYQIHIENENIDSPFVTNYIITFGED